jgi:hypothetical protein
MLLQGVRGPLGLPVLARVAGWVWLALALGCGGGQDGAAGPRGPSGAALQSGAGPQAGSARPTPTSGGAGAGISPAAGVPAGAPAGALIGFARWREPHEQVWIGLGGVDEVPAGIRALHSAFSRPRRAAELRALASTYAPFRLRTAEWDLAFYGRGRAPAGLVEQRMALEWTRRVMAEAAGGGQGESYGLVFSWHRGVAAGGLCDEVAVFLDGEVRAGPCAAGLPGGQAEGRLDPARLARLYAWYDALQAFQADGLQGVRADAPLERVIFAGHGASPPRPAEVTAIGELSAQLLRDLTAPAAPAPTLR